MAPEVRVVLKWKAILRGVALIPVCASPLFAHHAWVVDMSRDLTIKGTVTEYRWANPHVTVVVDVTDNGKVEQWELGGRSTGTMAKGGWGKETLKTGDVITAIGYRLANGENGLQVKRIVMSDGREMIAYGDGK